MDTSFIIFVAGIAVVFLIVHSIKKKIKRRRQRKAYWTVMEEIQKWGK